MTQYSLNAAILTERIAKDVARRLILRIELGENPADKKQRARKTPTYAAFLQSYWEVAAPTWKPSTCEIQSTGGPISIMRFWASSLTRSAMLMPCVGMPSLRDQQDRARPIAPWKSLKPCSVRLRLGAT